MNGRADSIKALLERAARLPRGAVHQRLQHELNLFALMPSPVLGEYLKRKVERVAAELEACPFPEPDPLALGEGDYVILNTAGGQEIRVSFMDWRANRVTHAMFAGQTGSGKSYLQACLLSQATRDCHSLVVDSSRFFRRLPCMLATHRFVKLSHLRLNPWDAPDGVEPRQVDQVVNHEICESYGLKFAEYEISQVVSVLREHGTPNLVRVLETLKAGKYSGFSKRLQYRDSAVLVLDNLLNATGDVLRCAKGMDVRRLLEGNTVVEMDVLPVHQAFFTRFFFAYLNLLAFSGRRLEKPLLVSLDEGQILGKQEGFASKILVLRHCGVHLLANYQDASECPVELTGNADLLVGFQQVNYNDRIAFGKNANLSIEQANFLGTLEPGTCVAFMSRSAWKHPIFGIVPRLQADDVGDAWVAEESKKFASQLSWSPLNTEAPASVAATDTVKGLDRQENAFLQDVLNQVHEFSSLTHRIERVGVRSAEKQGAVIKALTSRGLIRVQELAIGRGRPIKLCEPTKLAFELYGVSWKRGRGSLKTRAATFFMEKKIRLLRGWQVVKEGRLEVEGVEKQVDLLCYTPDERIVTVEIAGESAGHEVHNLHCLKSDRVVRHVVVATDRDVLKEVKRKFGEFPELANDSRVVTLTLAEALTNAERWTP